MNRYLTPGAIASLLILMLCFSCQEDAEVINNDALGPVSALTGIFTNMTVNQTNTINAIDSTYCFDVKLPVQVVVNGQQVSVATEADYSVVEAIFNQSTTDTDNLEYVYPITVVLPNYAEIQVSGTQQYNMLVNSCQWTSDYISSSCVALNYPITIFSYNSGYQMENTYVLNSNAEFYGMLQNIGSSEYYSVSYPISLTVNGGQTVMVNTNSGLQEVITGAVNACTAVTDACTNPGILTTDLVVYMPFSNTVADLKGNAVIAPIDTLFVPDRNNNAKCAISFNGNQHLQVTPASGNNLVQGDAFSISVWFKMQNTNPANLEYLFTKGSNGSNGFYLSVYDGNTPMFSVTGQGATGTTQLWDTNWNLNQWLWQDVESWHHIVLTTDADYNVKLYRDGLLQNSAVFTEGSIGTNTADYYIGQGFTGFLDDLRVYKKALTGSEVTTLFELEPDCYRCLE